MAKIWKTACAVTLTATLCFGLTACEFPGNKIFGGSNSNSSGTSASVTEVADKLGYENESEWISSVTGASSEARLMYEEAKADGYEGTYLDFLKEIGVTVNQDDSVNLTSSLLSSVAILSVFETNSSLTNMANTAASSGSGVIYSLNKEEGDAYIITNYHVVYEDKSSGKEQVAHISDEISVYLYGYTFRLEGAGIPATYVGGSMEHDIAVLRIEDSEILKNSYATQLSYADSDAVCVGERTYAIGNADGKGISVTQGVVSVGAEYITMEQSDPNRGEVSRLVMRTDAALNHGNSGGGLFDGEGKLIGIVSARSEESGVEGFGYAIPSNLAISIAQNVIDNSKVNESHGAYRATLGITIQMTDSRSVFDEETQKVYLVETITVIEVEVGKAASGYLKKGDILYSVKTPDYAETVLSRRSTLDWFLFDLRMGDTLQVVVLRDGNLKTEYIPFEKTSYFTLYN